MAFCSKCGGSLSGDSKYCPTCGNPVAEDIRGGGSYSQPSYGYQSPQPIKPDNNLVWAILATIFCCLPTGIYAIVLANKVDNLYFMGQYAEAQEAANGAKKWSIISAVAAVVVWALYILFYVVVFAAAIGLSD